MNLREKLMLLSKAELKARLVTIGKEAQDKGGEDLAAIMDEAKIIGEIMDEIKGREELAKAAALAAVEDDKADDRAGENGGEANSKSKKREDSGNMLKRGGSVSYSARILAKAYNAATGSPGGERTLSSEVAVMPKHTSADISPTFNDVSSLFDRVSHTPLPGGESYEKPFVKSYGDGAGVTAEGADYNLTEPVFGYAKINREKITAYSEVTEELAKLPAADYDGVIEASIAKAIKRYCSRQILIGNGTTSKFRGIFFNPTEATETVIAAATDVAINKIDENTLNEIIYAYGGDEDVEDPSVLILSKSDLKAFSRVRDKSGKKEYDIVNRGNTGTIDGIPFIINSACKCVSKASTGDYLMAYGPLSNYEVAIFADIDAQKSDHFKFRQGITAFRASTFMGGNVVAWNGFLRVKKGTPAAG